MRFFKSNPKSQPEPTPMQAGADAEPCQSDFATVAGGQARLDSNGKVVQQLAIDLETLLVVKETNS